MGNNQTLLISMVKKITQKYSGLCFQGWLKRGDIFWNICILVYIYFNYSLSL